VSITTNAPAVSGKCPPVEKLASLLAHREPKSLASDVLSILFEDFGAIAASLFYATRPPLHVRRGSFGEKLGVHVDRWEDEVEQRIATGPWRITSQTEPAPAWQPVKGTQHIAVYALLMEGRQVTGAICSFFPKERMPVGEQRAQINHFLRAAGDVVSLVSELSLTKQRMSQLGLFYQVAQVIASTVDLESILDDILELAMAVLDARATALIMVDEVERKLFFEYVHGDVGFVQRKRRIAMGEGIAGWVVAHGEPVVINDLQVDPRFDPAVDAWSGLTPRSVVCVPVQVRGKIVAVLEALDKRSEAGFDPEDLSLMITTANQASIAIEKNHLYQSLRDEQARIIQAQENVRRQVARNLHDGTVQFLSAISMGIDHLERLLEFKPEAARSELEALRHLTRQATQQARLALFELRPLILETQGLVPALEAYVQQLQNSEEFGVHFEADDALPLLSNSVAATVFAIVQEAVTNAKKHASPRDVWLRLSQEEEWLKVIVEDNGKGFDFESVEQNYDLRGSIGLLNMKERAGLLDGHVEIQSSTKPPSAGTTVTLRVPFSVYEGGQISQRSD
jgi:signal transduction histidine kinase